MIVKILVNLFLFSGILVSALVTYLGLSYLYHTPNFLVLNYGTLFFYPGTIGTLAMWFTQFANTSQYRRIGWQFTKSILASAACILYLFISLNN